jgi:DNA-binding transcriptional ArsR family regulator
MRTPLKQPYKQFFGTLANQVRLDIIEFLGNGSKNVGVIVENLRYDQSTISHSLKRLETCGFVTSQQKGKERIYTLNTKTIKPLLRLMHNHMGKYCSHIVGKKSDEKCH